MSARAAQNERASKASRPTPETMTQAKTWDHKKRRYLDAGFCHKCAGQAAWGHQLGFSNSKPVCGGCKGLAVPENAGARAGRWAANSAVEATK